MELDGNPAAPAGNTPGASPAPAGQNAAGNTPPSPGAQAGSGEPSPGSSPESSNMRQLREQYETTRNQLSEWSKLGDREEISSAYQSYKTQRDSVLEIGRGLGYSDEDILSSFREDPLGTIRFLHQKQADAGASNQNGNQQQDINKMLQQELDKRLKPITERENQRQTAEASQRYDTEFDRLYKQAFPEGLPEDVTAFLYDITTEMLSYDQDALKRIKTEGKVSDVAKYFDQAKERFLKVIAAWGAHEKKRTGQKPGGEAPPADDGKKKKFTLDDIIENPGVIDPKYA